MLRRAPNVLLALALTAALPACQGPDVGQSCTISWGPENITPAPTPVDLYASGGGDYFESGNLACEGLVCIVSPSAPGTTYGFTSAGSGYCSKPCVSDSDCFESKTGLVCRQMVLDPVFVEQLDPDTRSRYLGQIGFSSYCATPR
jgi:hypothetical protein